MEYQTEQAINQVPVRAELGMTFAAALRADAAAGAQYCDGGRNSRTVETAEIAIHASLTGHHGIFHFAHQ